jgi:hypothetical protein
MSARDDGTDRIGHGFMLHATEGLWSSIRDSIDFRRLTRDLLPPGPPSTPARYLIPPLLRGLLPVVAGIWKGLRTMQRRRRLLDIASRICQTIAREQIDCQPIAVPVRRIKDVEPIADSLIQRLCSGWGEDVHV